MIFGSHNSGFLVKQVHRYTSETDVHNTKLPQPYFLFHLLSCSIRSSSFLLQSKSLEEPGMMMRPMGEAYKRQKRHKHGSIYWFKMKKLKSLMVREGQRREVH